jgi:tetratricopeptide (TPR) repeat protein
VFALSNLALTMRARGQVQAAIDLLIRALRISDKANGAEHTNAAGIRQNLGSMLVQLERLDEALVEFNYARKIREAALGPEHPDVALLQADIGELLTRQGKHAEAEAALRGGLATLEASVGREHPDLGHPLVSLADLLLKTERASEALPLAERALRLRGADEAASLELATAQFAVARALVATGGDLARAVTLARAAQAGFPAAGLERVTVDRWLAKHDRR